MPIPNNKWKLAGLLLGIGLVFSILALLGMAEFHEKIDGPFLTRVDQLGMQIIHAHDSEMLTRLALELSWIGSPKVFVVAVGLISIAMWRMKLKEDAVVLFVAIISAGVLDVALKLHFRRLRPDVPWALAQEHSFSFPSGHSVGAVVLYGMVTYLLWKHLHALWQRVVVITLSILLIGGIGASRVYIGVHYPTDVAAGYLVGLFWLLTVIATNEYLNWAGRNHAVTPP